MKTLGFVLIFLLAVMPVYADWNVGDPYKMHYPQLPKTNGLDVEFAASTLADDWRCSQSGPVSDIHFWISWMKNLVQPIQFINVSIYSDIPANQSGLGYSIPGAELWSRQFLPPQFTIRDMPDNIQDWYDPSEQWPFNFGKDDHLRWQQINIDPIFEPYMQQKDTIYWLAIDFGIQPYVGWKESGSTHFNDDAVWWDGVNLRWKELRHPDPQQNYSIDLAFVITPEPATIAIFAIGALAVLRKRL